MYRSAEAGVRVDLMGGSGNTGEAAGDVRVSIERLEGSYHADDLRGDEGDNRLFGVGGADVLYGRGGDDELKGGGGADAFHFKRGYDRDRVADFENNVDRLCIDRDLGVRDAGDVLARARNVGDDVVIDFGQGDVLRIENASRGQLENDLVLV